MLTNFQYLYPLELIGLFKPYKMYLMYGVIVMEMSVVHVFIFSFSFIYIPTHEIFSSYY